MESLFLKACHKKETDRTPIWLMRQAGRYQKTYRQIRSRVGFLELCKNSDLAAQVTVDAVRQFDFDAGIIFSDILLLGEAMGFDLSFGENHGPRIGNPFRNENDLKKIHPVDPSTSLSFVAEAIKKTKKELGPKIPLIGFAGAPFTLASYLIEGGSSKNFSNTRQLISENPRTWHGFIDKITEGTIDYLSSQIEAGADVIQLFDSWVGNLTLAEYTEFVFPSLQKIVQSLQKKVPLIYFGTQTYPLFPKIKDLGFDVVGVDWRISLNEAWNVLGDVAVQGNLDPQVLLMEPGEVQKQALKILESVNGRSGYIFNLGHGILPQTPEDNVRVLVQTVKNYEK